MQYVNTNIDANSASATNITPGAQTVGSGTLSASSSSSQSRTLGFFVEEAVALRDRLFLTGAIRTDQNSAFGTNFQHVYYPKVSASWVVSDESFFPHASWLTSLRLRSAYGASGVQPGATSALASLSTTTGNVNGVDVSGLRIGSIDNPNLKPERSSELEGGLESSLFGGRATFEVTRYYKRTKDALGERGGCTVARLGVEPDEKPRRRSERWLGRTRSSRRSIDRRNFAFDFTLSGSINRNMVLSLGGTPSQTSNDTRIAEGYPIGGYWEIPLLGWNDKNHDGILTYNKDPALSEVSFDGDTSKYMGVSIPPQQITFMPGIELLNHKLRLQSTFDYRGGNHAIGLTDIVMCDVVYNCIGRNDPHASLFEQARALEYIDPSPVAAGGDTGPGHFVKWRELSATFTLPDRWAKLASAQGATVAFSARNLQTWTKYPGVDPENSTNTTGGSGDAHLFDQVVVGSAHVLRRSRQPAFLTLRPSPAMRPIQFRRAVCALLGIAPVVFAGCQNSVTDSLLNADQPGLIDPSNVNSAAGADAIRLGALVTLRGITTAWTLGGLMGDEWDITVAAGITGFVDQRRGSNPFAISAFTSVLRAVASVRTSANQAIPLLNKWTPTPVANIAEMYFARGYAELQIAADFCNGIPLDDGNASPPVYTMPLTNAQILRCRGRIVRYGDEQEHGNGRGEREHQSRGAHRKGAGAARQRPSSPRRRRWCRRRSCRRRTPTTSRTRPPRGTIPSGRRTPAAVRTVSATASRGTRTTSSCRA